VTVKNLNKTKFLLAIPILAFGAALMTGLTRTNSSKPIRRQNAAKENTESKMYKKLTPQEEYVLVKKGTEPPFSGKYYDHHKKGTYTCKRCGAKLFNSSAKFEAGCGWPSFDDQITDAVKWQPDPDGRRTEITCANCGAHLGHVFLGEGFTQKNTRHCVNSISLDFVPAKPKRTETAIFASGCFWGTQYRSAIFYFNDRQKYTAQELVEKLRKKGYDVRTEITSAKKFWPAEKYHQHYYEKNRKAPYCHIYRRFF